MNLLVVVPAYNEEACLADTIAMLKQACPDVDYLIVDDGSSDATLAICQEQGFNHVSLPVNTGLTSGFRTGMKYAWRKGYDAVLQFDADGQHLPQYIPAMADAMQREQAAIVIGSRVLNGETIEGARGMGSRLISWLIKVTTGATITDPTSGMRMYSRTMIERFATDFDTAPEPDTVAWATRKGHKVVEVPVAMQERQGGESYLKLASIIRYMSRTCLSIILFQWLR